MPTDAPDEQLVRDLDETGLLARIFPLLPAGAATLVGPGDDAAVVAAPDRRFVVSTDVLVEGRHFRREWSSGEDVGRRAAAQNLADVAAMGARPTALVVSLVVPGDLPVAWVTGLARGLAGASEPSGAAVVGGDLSGGRDVVVAVTVHGDLEGRPPVLRSGARPGDVVALSGVRGWSAAGLAVLSTGGGAAGGRPDGGPSEDRRDADVDRALAAYRAPAPPLADGPAAAVAGATAMLDVSDGLLRDAGRIAAASGVAIDLDGAALRPDDGLVAVADTLVRAGGERGAGAELAATWVLTGGEDHGLLATFPAGTALPGGFRPVGRVRTAAAGEGRVSVDGAAPRVSGTGWDHFGGR
ncbi:thiamine-phosphate kinase [Luteimicrobium subarcticum]|uniref:Thiamine-monophosphate kinase n=1 Tax=Luteimicrobium subarcticum TaxID=620910 RepID=A0A2M8WQR7_9MICO|nr:thiamine-phosphate kinase [Luteimicrobium subarcticum]PJI93257.1 thiamine-phosphate kinase [Luteimicrobium subarcticum]